jgi:hypothetical protein
MEVGNFLVSFKQTLFEVQLMEVGRKITGFRVTDVKIIISSQNLGMPFQFKAVVI